MLPLRIPARPAYGTARPDEFLRIKCGRNVKVGGTSEPKEKDFHISFAEIAGMALPAGDYDLRRIAAEPAGRAHHSGPAYLPAVAGNIDLTILNFEISTVASICKKIAASRSTFSTPKSSIT